MSSAWNAQYGSPSGGGGAEWAGPAWRGPWGPSQRRCWKSAAWRPIELIAMVLGFIVFWPIGLAILGWKMCGREWKRGEFAQYASERWRHAARKFERSARGERWRPFDTGNSAFDDWKAAEIGRLEEERRRLDEAHREFAEFLRNLHRARDREEFERFMAQRRPNGEPPRPADDPPGPAA